MSEQAASRAPLPFPSEDRNERLRYYRLDRLVKALPKLPERRGDLHFDPKREDSKPFYIRAPVESLADLKLWMGYPNDHIDHTRYWQHLRCVPVPLVEQGKAGDVLCEVPPQVVEDAEYNVLHGFVDEVLLAHPFWKAIVTGLLKRRPYIDILAIDDLIVADGQTVTISNTPTAFFHRVTVHGSGSIVFESACKLIADTVEHVP